MSRLALYRELDRPDRDLAKAHPLVQERWPRIEERLAREGYRMMLNEVYRAELRQQWLWAQGRTAVDCRRLGIPEDFARSGPRVTNAWTAKKSAHGWTELYHPPVGPPSIVPASCALDVVPVGADGRAWTHDDPWDAFVALIDRIGAEYGLVHFESPGKGVWDKPHLEAVEWSNSEHRLVLPAAA